jgi:hypothetical protein
MISGKKKVTAEAAANSIGYVPALVRSEWRARCQPVALTKRRAVDFCRVSTAICPA